MNMYEENKVTLHLIDFLKIRDDAKMLEEIKNFAEDNRCSYDSSRRSDSEIGEYVRTRFGIPEKIEEDI